PERGTRRDDIHAGIRTMGFERRATIVFRVMENEVVIVRIFYGGQDYERRLRDTVEEWRRLPGRRTKTPGGSTPVAAWAASLARQQLPGRRGIAPHPPPRTWSGIRRSLPLPAEWSAERREMPCNPGGLRHRA